MRRRTPPDLAHRGRARSAPPTPAARTPATCAATGASGERQPGFRQGTCASRCARGAAHRGSRRIAPTHAARSGALSAPSTAVACGRPRRGAVAAVVPRWSHDDDQLPGGRVTRALPPPAKGHGRGAWCKRRNRTAGGRWGPHLPGQPASRLHPHALVRAAFDNVGSDRHGLWVRHADTHAQSNTPAARGLTMRRSPSIGRAEARATDATRGRLARSRRSSRPLERSDSTAQEVGFDRWNRSSRPFGSGESESFKGRLDSTRSVEWADGRSTRSPDSTLPLWRVALSRGRLAAASGPPPRSDSTAATTCAAATSSAGPSYKIR